MDRPVMNPSLLLEIDRPKSRSTRLGRIAHLMSYVWRVLLFEPLAVFRRRPRVVEGATFSRVCRGILYRLIGLPFVVVAVAAVMVFNGTHPPVVDQSSDPQSVGIYHDPVTFLADDGTRLEGWLVPVVDARRVLAEREEALRKQRPAAILVHDYGATREQMLPLVRPLHDAGFVVMVLSLRGSDSKVPAGQTFGLRESGDVRAAVEVLRRRPSIDRNRISLVGAGTGATAALLAAKEDPEIAALVLDNPVKHATEVLERIGPSQPWLTWMRPTCKLTFNLAYGVNADDVDLRGLQTVLKNTPSLMLDNGTAGAAGLRRHTVEQVVQFLLAHGAAIPAEAPVAAAEQ